jgi:hypothetical protein
LKFFYLNLIRLIHFKLILRSNYLQITHSKRIDVIMDMTHLPFFKYHGYYKTQSAFGSKQLLLPQIAVTLTVTLRPEVLNSNNYSYITRLLGFKRKAFSFTPSIFIDIYT